MDNLSRGWRMRVKKALESEGISYRQLSIMTGLNYATIQSHLAGNLRNESLTFIRQVCEVVDMPLATALFGAVVSKDNQLSQVPLLPDEAVLPWATGQIPDEPIVTWLPHPTVLSGSLRLFGWQLSSSDLHPLWPIGSWLYVDPDKIPVAKERAVVLACIKGNVVARWREVILGEIWLVPEREIYQACRLDDGQIIGSVIGGLKSSDVF